MMVKNLVFVPMHGSEIGTFMATGIEATSEIFKNLCVVCTDPERTKPGECTFVVHNPSGDQRYMYISAESSDEAREICAQRVNDWANAMAG